MEVKDRVLTLVQVSAKVEKARARGVTELLFLAQRGIAQEQRSEIEALRDREFAGGLNMYIVEDVIGFIRVGFALAGERGRSAFLARVCKALESQSLGYEHRKAWADLLLMV